MEEVEGAGGIPDSDPALRGSCGMKRQSPLAGPTESGKDLPARSRSSFPKDTVVVRKMLAVLWKILKFQEDRMGETF